VEKFIENLKAHSEFDIKTISNLKELATSGHLINHEMVEIAIKAHSGEENENN